MSPTSYLFEINILDVLHIPAILLISKRLSGSLLVLAIMVMSSGCAGSVPANKSEINKNNALPLAVPQKPVSTVPPSTTQRLDTKLNIQFDWWKLLQSTRLNSLLEQGFNAYPTVEEVQILLLKLQQNEISREGFFYPAVSVKDAENGQGHMLLVQDVTASADAKFIGDAYYDIHAWQLTVGYVPELLRIHQQSGSINSEAEIQYLQLEATYRTYAGNLIASIVQDASLRAQMAVARKIVAIEQSLLAVARKRNKVGLATQMEVTARQQSLEFATQALRRLTAQFEQLSALIHLLLGIPAGKDLPETTDFTALNLTMALPLELSATLIEQRPDVRAAQLEMLPANTKYQKTAEVALKNVGNTLLAIHNDAITLKAAITSEQANFAALESTRKQNMANKLNYQDVLIAELDSQLAALRSVQTRAKNLGNAILLYHALGGGWWVMDDAVRLEIANELIQKKLAR